MEGEQITEVGNKCVGRKSAMSLEEYDVAVSLLPINHHYDTVVNIGLHWCVTNYALHKGKAELSGTACCHPDWSHLGMGERV